MDKGVIFRINPLALSNVFDRGEVLGGYVNLPYVIRLDGVNFGRVLKGFEEPRDPRVHRALVEGCRNLMKFFNSDFCYIVSDEVNVFSFRYNPYGGRFFKITSISSSILSSHASLSIGRPVYFDSRVIVLLDHYKAIPYLLYRVRIGFANYVSKLYTMYIDKNTIELQRMVRELEERGINVYFDWRSIGTCLYIARYRKRGFNPIDNVYVDVERRTILESSDIFKCIENLLGILKSIGIRGS